MCVLADSASRTRERFGSLAQAPSVSLALLVCQVHVARLSAEEVAQAFDGRTFQRLADAGVILGPPLSKRAPSGFTAAREGSAPRGGMPGGEAAGGTDGARDPPTAGDPLVCDRLATLLVDPPRAGLDEASTSLAARFARVLYISCNPTTLARDVSALTATHDVVRLAAFDQFPYTPHLEAGVLLERRPAK